MINSLRHTSRSLLIAAALLAALHALQVNQAQAQAETEDSDLRVYDNFNAPNIDPLRWYTGYSCAGKATLECIRQIQGGRLHLRTRTYGDRTSNVGAEYGPAEFSLVNPAPTDIAVDLTMLHVNTSPCATSPGAGTFGQAILYGNFFNDGSGTPSGDTTALLVLDRVSSDPPNVAHASATVQYQGVFLDWITIGSFNIGERVRIELKWDKSNHQFLASLSRPAYNTTAQIALPYPSSDSAPAAFPQKAVGVRGFPENCTGVPTYVDIEAAFDRVLVN